MREMPSFRWKFPRPPLWLNALLVIALAAMTFFLAKYGAWAMAVDLKKVSNMPATSVIYDRNGYVIQRLYDENRVLVNSRDLPQVLKDAVVAKEDKRFYWHFGFDPIAILRSAVVNLTGRKITTGASTITQQLARNSVAIFDRTLDRKIKEVFLAMRIEAAFSKDEILTFYLNRIFLGGNIYGVGAASEAYFGKKPIDLNLSESAMIAGIIAGPNSFSPWKNARKAREVRAITLDQMVDAGFIKKELAEKTKQEPLTLRPRLDLPGSYVTSAVQDSLPQFISKDLLFRGGLQIHTTIDISFQRNAEQQIEASLSKVEKTRGYPHKTRAAWLASEPDDSSVPPYLQASFVALNNRDGSILAVVGGRQFDESSFNRVLNGRRQIGSTIKPFIYAHAFNTLNFTACTDVDSSPFDLTKGFGPEIIEGENPKWITVRQALAQSDNYCVMRTGLATGVESFAYFFQQCTGVLATPYASSFLGTPELTTLDLAKGYSAFANYGVIIEPFLVESISTHEGQLIYRHIDTRKRVLSPQVAFQIHDLLAGVVDEGTGSALRSQFGFKGPMAGKTGTTNDYKDSWFCGYNTEVTAALWVGYDNPKTIMSGGYSSRIAVPTWAAIMKPSLEPYPPADFVPPPGLQKAQMKKEVTTFFFFKKESISGRPEWIRDDQRGTALSRLDHKTPRNIQPLAQGPSLWDRAVGLIWKPEEKDRFASMPEDPGKPRAVIQDNTETIAPKAVPVEE
jgi:membrane peptidoglycan carboxypeptidase